MTRPLFVVTCLVAVSATIASAQDYYPQQMNYPASQYSGGYGPGMPPAPNYSAGQGPQQGPQMQGSMAIPAPRPKLPPGVTDENGLLYYNGPAYGNPYPMGSPGPIQKVSYQQMAMLQSGPRQDSGSSPSVMSGGGNSNGGGIPSGQMQSGGMSGGGMPGQGMVTDDNGDAGYGGGEGDGSGSCGPGGCGGRGCGPLGLGLLNCHLFDGSLFPGKVGCCWTAGYDNLLMFRDPGSTRILAQDINTLDTEFNANQFHFDPSYGGRTFLQFMGPSGVSIQGVYTKIATLVADGSVADFASLQIPSPLVANTVDYFGADVMQFHYTSAIQGAELNVIKPFGSIELLAGFRYMEINESMRLTTINSGTGGISDYDTDAFNEMYGGQIGMQGRWTLFDLLGFDFGAKFGVFGDRNADRQVMYDLNNSVIDPPFPTSAKNQSTAYIGELSAQMVLPINSSISIHGGYSVMFINQIALAPDQATFQLDSGTHVDMRGDIILHGANFGVTAVW